MNTRSKNKFYIMIALLISTSLLLGACTSATSSPAPAAATAPPATAEQSSILEPITQAELVGAIWQWAGGREPLGAPPFQVPAPEKYTLSFSEDGSLFIQADCNTSR